MAYLVGLALLGLSIWVFQSIAGRWRRSEARVSRPVKICLALAIAVCGLYSGSFARGAHAIAATNGIPAGVTPGAAYETNFVSMTAAAQQTAMSQMVTAGVQWLRIDTPSDFRFATMTRLAQANGIRVDAVLQAWTTSLTPAAFAAFATNAVQTLKPIGVETYEILNEPNCLQYCLSAASYTQILRASYQAIKAADPTATVLAGGLGPNNGSNEPYNYLIAMYQAGATGFFDAFNVHPYSYPDTPLQTGDSWNPWSYLPQLHSIMVANGDGIKPIWLTEFGCPTGKTQRTKAYCTDSSLALQITDAFTSASALGYIGPLLIYNWQDSRTDGDFGLHYVDGTPKPASLSAYTSSATQYLGRALGPSS